MISKLWWLTTLVDKVEIHLGHLCNTQWVFLNAIQKEMRLRKYDFRSAINRGTYHETVENIAKKVVQPYLEYNSYHGIISSWNNLPLLFTGGKAKYESGTWEVQCNTLVKICELYWCLYHIIEYKIDLGNKQYTQWVFYNAIQRKLQMRVAETILEEDIVNLRYRIASNVIHPYVKKYHQVEYPISLLAQEWCRWPLLFTNETERFKSEMDECLKRPGYGALQN